MEKESYSRRSFLNKLWVALGVVAFAEVVAVAISFFKPQKAEPAADELDAIVIAGAVDSFEPGTVSAFVQGKFYLARLDDGGFLAMSRNCTHLSCSVPWISKENKFICPCHSSEFDIKGEVINPPAPRALDLYPVAIENNILSVDTSKPRRRSVFEPNQVVYVKKT
jgi:cytochrome b6-f complex iron-sulfur subunit